MLEQLYKFANQLREEGQYKTAQVLYPIITELAAVEGHTHLKEEFQKAYEDLLDLKAELKKVNLIRLASEVDIIARDIEQKIIQFNFEDPIQSILDSYKTMHRIASTGADKGSILSEIVQLAEDESVPDSSLPEEIRKRTVGMSENDKKEILYVLEKDHNLFIPLEKIAKKSKKEKKEEELTKEEKELECLEEAKDIKSRIDCLKDEDGIPFDMYRSFPTGPNIWTGFAYEAVIPYSQSSQVNYWSLASKDEEKILKRIASTK